MLSVKEGYPIGKGLTSFAERILVCFLFQNSVTIPFYSTIISYYYSKKPSLPRLCICIFITFVSQ